ncbi:MAG: hypothetical protein MJ078_01475 [Clostridia bacterium]|nr:hypothetical protein [Clostridia bacterium]
MEDNELLLTLQRVREGEEAAFSLLKQTYEPLLSRLLAEFVKGLCDAARQELSGEAAIALHQAALHYESPTGQVSFGLYARICIRHALTSWHRKHPRTPVCSLDENEFDEWMYASVNNDPSDRLTQAEDVIALCRKLSLALSDYEKKVFNLLAIGHRVSDIAGALGESPKSVSNAVCRIKAKVQIARGRS